MGDFEKGGVILKIACGSILNCLYLDGGSNTALWFTVLIRIEGKVQMRQKVASAPVSLVYVLCVEIKFF